MKALKAMRTKIKIGDLWVSPKLHVLLTKEDDVFVARCLDFTVSSHGEDEEDAIKSLAEAIQEYILTSIENSGTENLYDPAHNKYWRMFNELEAKQLFLLSLTEKRQQFRLMRIEWLRMRGLNRQYLQDNYEIPA